MLVAFFFSFYAHSQNIFVSEQFRKAIEKGSRTTDGRPGKNYFTNHSDYTIKVKFDPKTGKITGEETITYHNNSPDTLDKIVLRLYQDFFKKGQKRDFPVDPRDVNDGTVLKSVIIDGTQYDTQKISRYATLATIKLQKNIAPHSTAKLRIEWECQIPLHHPIRYGKYADNAYFVGYWYPQIAVYDDVYGWATSPFTGAQEYYNDHNNYDVYIKTVFPYVVWSSGVLQNADEIFTKEVVKRLEKARKSDKVVHIITEEDYNKGLFLSKEYITWHFTGKKIPDFAFAVAKNYNWDGVSLNTGTHRTFISTAYNARSKGFYKLDSLTREIIKTFSYKVPAIEFPYPQMTIFNGGGAMEYPMMVNLANFEDCCTNIYVTAHEVGHSYFPFATGTNETVFAWMDEGLINYFPRYVQHILNDTCNSFDQMVNKYMDLAGTDKDLPIMVPSNTVSEYPAYRHIAYNKPSFAFYQLTKYLGEDKFFEALREFAKQWKYKHPYPYDFFNTFDRVSGQDLSWFWNAYFFEFKYPDIAITSAKYENGKLNLTLQNKGGLPVETVIKIKTKDGEEKTLTEPMSIWKNSNTYTVEIETAQPAEITIDIPDVYTENNTLTF